MRYCANAFKNNKYGVYIFIMTGQYGVSLRRTL